MIQRIKKAKFDESLIETDKISHIKGNNDPPVIVDEKGGIK